MQFTLGKAIFSVKGYGFATETAGASILWFGIFDSLYLLPISTASGKPEPRHSCILAPGIKHR
jgi:hypothetical protein